MVGILWSWTAVTRTTMLTICGLHLLSGCLCLAVTTDGMFSRDGLHQAVPTAFGVPNLHTGSRLQAGSSSSSSTQSSHSRRLLHIEAIDTADTADMADAAAMAEMVTMYPRDSRSINRYLTEALKSRQTYEVPVWFVVVLDPRNPRSMLSQQQVSDQIQLLNRAYTTGLPDKRGVISEDAPGTGSAVLWRFRLMGVRYTSSNTPMCIGSKLEEQIKSQWHPQLVQETRNAGLAAAADRTLIIYTSDLTSPACSGYVPGFKALFGWSNTPMELQIWKKRQQGFKDGVVLDFRYLYHSDAAVNEAGGKSLRGASTGAQLVHEVGHWMGLLHTFVGGCSTSMAYTDGVDDTPPEANPRAWGVDLGDASGGCPSSGTKRDSCPNFAGADDHTNYMSYNNLACAKRFTPGQQARMLYVYSSMRASAL